MTAPMTAEQLAEIEQRANAATKGPWVWEAPRSYPQSITNAQAILIAETYISPDAPADDTEFIAHARQDVPALLAEVKRLQAAPIDPQRVDRALRAVIAELDYDLHKAIESDEETGEDTYHETVADFIKAYEAEAGEGE